MDVSNVGRIFLILSLIRLGLADFPNKTFSCRSGEYIEKNQFCDRSYQCSDHSDEPKNCISDEKDCDVNTFYCHSKELCIDVDDLSDIPDETLCFNQDPEDLVECSEKEVKFLCNDRRCLDMRMKCYCNCFNFFMWKYKNNESKSAFILDSKNCTFQNEKFLCNDTRRCLSLEYVCDGSCNCFDCSDEYGDCDKIDEKLLATCPDSYFPTPKGAQCIQDLIHGSAENNFSKIDDLTNCTSEHFCDQNCALYKGRAICSCAENYSTESKSSHGFKCESVSSNNAILIYSTQSLMKLWDFPSEQSIDIKPVEGVVFTAAGDNLYYTNSSGVIFNHSISSNQTDISVNGTILESPITSIAVDYITNNVYFTTNTTLSVCSTEKVCMYLIKGQNVSHVALAPQYRRMFYVKQLEHRRGYFITRANMDGSEEAVLIDMSYGEPTPLTVDESIKRIYWLDQINEIILSKSIFDSDNEVRTFKYTGKVMSIAALDSTLYFTKNLDNEIHTLENNENFVKSIDKNSKSIGFNFYSDGLIKSTASNERLIVENRPIVVQYLYAYNSVDQNKLDGNPCQNLSPPCTGVCLLRPKSTNPDYQCLCDWNVRNDQCWQRNLINDNLNDSPEDNQFPTTSTTDNFKKNQSSIAISEKGSTTDKSKTNQPSTAISANESTADESKTNQPSTTISENESTTDESKTNQHSTTISENESTTDESKTNQPSTTISANESTADESKTNQPSTTISANETTTDESKTNQPSTTVSDNESTAVKSTISSISSTETDSSESFQAPSSTPTTSKATSEASEDNEKGGLSIGWIVIGVIMLVVFVLCGVYVYNRRAGYSQFSVQDFAWSRNEGYNEHILIHDEEL